MKLEFKKWLEAFIIGCKPGADYQIAGACSDLKRKKSERFSTKSKNFCTKEVSDASLGK